MADNPTNGDIDSETKILQTKIARQIEYYFGDHNLAKDKFLKEAIKENDGWIALDTLLTFNRLKNLSTDKELIIKAIKDSANNLLEVSESNDKIRRSAEKPLPEDTKELKLERETRSVYSKGFPAHANLDEILEFFETFGNIESVHMRRFYSDKKFKGSVFVLFKTIEEAEKFVKLEDVSFKGTPLARESSKNYHDRKAGSRQKNKDKQKKNSQSNDEVTDDAKPEGDADMEVESKPDMKIGCILHLNGFGDNTSREDIKEIFDDHAKVAWVDFSRGDTEAWVRFEEPGTATIALAKALNSNDGKLEIKNSEITHRILKDDEEVEYWKKIRDSMQKVKAKKNQRGSSRGRGGRSGRGGRNDRSDRWKGKGRRFNDDKSKKTDESTAKPKSIKFGSDSEDIPSTNEKTDKEENLKRDAEKAKLDVSEPPVKVMKLDEA